MNTRPLVSIALCTYNGARFLRQQLESIINQSYKNLEIVIVDDCSSDNSAEIIAGYAGHDSRIRFFQNETNLGFNKNFEKAIRLTSGDFIAISDQDDIWEADKIEVLLENIGDNWLIFSNSALIDDDGKALNRTLLRDFSLERCNYMGFLFQNFVTGHSILIRRELLSYILPIPSKSFYDWWIGFIAVYEGKAIFIDRILTQYRVHSSSVMQLKETKMLRDRKVRKQSEYQKIGENLETLLTYPRLKVGDKHIIEEVKNAFNEKQKRRFSSSLFTLIITSYKQLFPDNKPRKGLSLLTFAAKYARGL